MAHYNYIIVGQGIAGTAIVQQLIDHNKNFIVFDTFSTDQSSRVAAGIWNPVVLKRMKKLADVDEMLPLLLPFYKRTEDLFDVKIIDNTKVNRIFHNAEETNEWITKCDHQAFENLLNPKINHSTNEGLMAPLGLGEVTQSGRIDTINWLNAARNYLVKNNLLIAEVLDYTKIKHTENGVAYKNITADGIIFCDGMKSAFENPYFNNLPFNLTKGELLIIKCEQLKLTSIVNGGVFILPLGNDLYKIGATYNWDDIDTSPTEGGKTELLEKLNKILTAPFTIVDHQCGIRPTINDRRPLLGTHPEYEHIHIFNGLGSRGVFLVPYLTQHFMKFLFENSDLPREINIARFKR